MPFRALIVVVSGSALSVALAKSRKYGTHIKLLPQKDQSDLVMAFDSICTYEEACCDIRFLELPHEGFHLI